MSNDHNDDDVDPRDIERVTEALRAIEPTPSEPDWREFERDTMRAIRADDADDADRPSFWARARQRFTPARIGFGVAIAGAATVALIAFFGHNDRSSDLDGVVAGSAANAGDDTAVDEMFVPSDEERAPLDVRAALIADSGDLSAMEPVELDRFTRTLFDDAELSFDDDLAELDEPETEAGMMSDDVFGDGDDAGIDLEPLDELPIDERTLDNLFPRRPEAG